MPNQKNTSRPKAAAAQSILSSQAAVLPSTDKASSIGSAPSVNSPKRVVYHFLKVAASGLVASSVLTLFAESGAPGAQAAAHDLWDHAWLIHPFLYCLVLTVVCIAVALHGARIAEIALDTKIFKPLLEAMSHILSFSFGALVPLTAVSDAAWLSLSCQGVATIALLEFWLALIAALAIAGGLIVEDRHLSANVPENAGSRASAAPPSPTNAQVLIFFVLACFFSWVAYWCAHMTGSTQHVLEEYLAPLAKYACQVR